MRLLLAFLALVLSAVTASASSGVLELRTITVDGLSRSFWVYQSTKLANGGQPLVFLIHGGGGQGSEAFIRQTSMQQAAERDGYVLIAPQSYGSSWNYGDTLPRWLQSTAVDDMAFFDALIAFAKTNYGINPGRVFATGVSAGGVMSYRLACERPGVFAAVAPVAGSKNTSNCPGAVNTALLHIHGLSDAQVPMGGNGTFPPVLNGINQWAQANGCPAQSKVTIITSATDQHQWSPCTTDVEVLALFAENGGHTWAPDFEVSTTNTVLAFFGRQ